MVMLSFNHQNKWALVRVLVSYTSAHTSSQHSNITFQSKVYLTFYTNPTQGGLRALTRGS